MKPIATLPRLEIQVDDADLPRELEALLSEVRVRRHLSRPTLCELVFQGGPEMDVDVAPQVGEPLRVKIGGESAPLFEGDVTAVQLAHLGDGEVQLRVRGYDRLHRLRLRQPVRERVEMTVEELARELVEDLGLSVQAEDPGPLRRRILQHRRSDWQLLVQETAKVGLFLTLQGRTLHLVSLQGRGRPVSLRCGDDLLESRFEVNGAATGRSVEVAAWDPSTVEGHLGLAFEPRSGRDVGETAPPARFGLRGERTASGRLADHGGAAASEAQALVDVQRAAEVMFWGVAEGRGDLMPGTVVDVTGAGRRFSGRHVLTAVEHRIDGVRGFVSELSSEPPSIPRTASEGAEAAWGKVTRVDDPEGLGRVRVQLPAHGDLESGWWQVVCPAAGPDKGFVSLPEVDDHVLVLLLGGDAARGVVLGGLFGTTSSPRRRRQVGARRALHLAHRPRRAAAARPETRTCPAGERWRELRRASSQESAPACRHRFGHRREEVDHHPWTTH